ncbi:MAG: ribulose-phosphate 3-epimerase [Thermotogae bacterium]|nr:ribulose-phosphate 3-epimerase [Thermotogota bacterium]
MYRIGPSIIAADWASIYEELERAKEGDFIHVDVMDGHFVPNLTLGPDIARAIHRRTGKPLDIHLMLTHPDRYVDRFIFPGVFRITLHYESSAFLSSTLRRIRSAGLRAGVAISPETPVSRLMKLLHRLDQVLVMTVYPGFAGQRMLEWVLPKVKALATIREERGLQFTITVDGGVRWDNLHLIGPADEVVMGSAFFGSRRRA